METENLNNEEVRALYTAKTVLNAQMQQEASMALAPKSSKYMTYVVMGLCVVMMGVLIWQYVRSGDQQNILLILLLAAIGGYMVYSQLTMAKKMIKRWEVGMENTYGTTQLHLTTEFYKLTLAQTLEEGDDIVVENYSELSGIKETEHLFLLRRNRSSWFFIAKDGLTGCTVEEFRSFISSRIGG